MVDGRTIFPIYHPAAALRSTEMLNTLREDFKKLPKVLAGEITVEIPPAVAELNAMQPTKAAKEGESAKAKPKQPGLF